LVAEHGVNLSPAPAFNLDEEYDVQQAVSKLIAADAILSAHDVSEGGLFINLLESAMAGNFGFEINKTHSDLRNDAFLFGEAQSRIVVSVASQQEAEAFLKANGINYEVLGKVTKCQIVVNGHQFGNTTDFALTYQTALENKLN